MICQPVKEGSHQSVVVLHHRGVFFFAGRGLRSRKFIVPLNLTEFDSAIFIECKEDHREPVGNLGVVSSDVGKSVEELGNTNLEGLYVQFLRNNQVFEVEWEGVFDLFLAPIKDLVQEMIEDLSSFLSID